MQWDSSDGAHRCRLSRVTAEARELLGKLLQEDP
eukprot:COSAG01_NODE_61247_length_290_cov_1.089005_1_plen_33_part_10